MPPWFYRGTAVYQFGLVQPIDLFGQGVVVALVTDAQGGLYAYRGQAFGAEN